MSDTVKIVSLPKFWGSDDIRGKFGIIRAMSNVKGYCTVLVEGRMRTLRLDGLEKASEKQQD